MAVMDSGLKASLRPTALALARFASDDGGNIFPSVERVSWLAMKTERQVRADIGALLDVGILVAETPRTGGRHRATRYRMRVEKLPARPPYTPKGGSGLPAFTGDVERKDGSGLPPFSEEPGSRLPGIQVEPGSDFRKPGSGLPETRKFATGNPEVGFRRSVNDPLERSQEGRNCDSSGEASQVRSSSAETGRVPDPSPEQWASLKGLGERLGLAPRARAG
jgi:hypothetical protein